MGDVIPKSVTKSRTGCHFDDVFAPGRRSQTRQMADWEGVVPPSGPNSQRCIVGSTPKNSEASVPLTVTLKF